MIRSTIHKVRKRNVHGLRSEIWWVIRYDSWQTRLIVICICRAIRHRCVYATYSLYEAKTCNMHAECQIKTNESLCGVLKCRMLHGEKRFDRIQIWLQNAEKYIRNAVSLASKYSYINVKHICVCLCEQKNILFSRYFFLLI